MVIRSTLSGYKVHPVGLLRPPCWASKTTLVLSMSPDMRRLQQVVVLLSDKVVLLSDKVVLLSDMDTFVWQLDHFS